MTQVMIMKNALKNIALAMCFTFAASNPSFAADCFVDYKAKQSANGLKLHYGVMQLPDGACKNRGNAQQVVSARLAKNGWTLLTILSILDANGAKQRQGNAGAYFLRY